MSLQLTFRELEELVEDRLPDSIRSRFKIHWDDIPIGDARFSSGSPLDYMEDDGRQYRFFEFTDLETQTTYSFSYVWHPEFSLDFPYSLITSVDDLGFEIVKTSVINPP